MTYPYPLAVDVSRYQDPDKMDYAALVQAGVQLAAVRLSVSDYYIDDARQAHVEGFKSQGIPVLGYHVNRPGQSIQGSIAKMDEARAGLALDGLVLDAELSKNSAGVEQSQATIRNDCYQHLTAIANRADVVLAYTRASFWNPKIGFTTWAPQLARLWEARYYWPNASAPYISSGWREAGESWSAWQWTDKGPWGFDTDFVTQELLDAFKPVTPQLTPTISNVTVVYDPSKVKIILQEATL